MPQLVYSIAAVLAVWYIGISGEKDKYPESPNYPLPEELIVKESTLPYHLRVEESGPNAGREVKYIKLSELDLSEKFVIKTDRYTIENNKDWLVSRFIGHILSVPTKLFFWDSKVSSVVDDRGIRKVISMLESNPDLAGTNLTVRFNHTAVFRDAKRLFQDQDVKERNPWLARVAWALPTSVISEPFMELSRSDYYNPATQTIVLYSNVSSIAAHEIGHHQDYQKWNSDWAYSLSGYAVPVKLYKEWTASQNAKEIMSKDDAWQFKRYLLPAFGTYL